MTDAQQNVLQEYYDRFQAYVQSKSNSVFARYRLHSKIQEPGETCQQFVTASKLLVKDWVWTSWRSHCARHNRVWHKIRQKVREKLIDTGSDLTLERATRVDEVSVQRLKEMKDETEQGVHAVKKKNWRHKDSKSNAATHTCGRCGRKHGDAPGMGKVCRKCKIIIIIHRTSTAQCP